MTNSLVANPWVLDTAGTTTLWTEFAKIRHIEFVSYVGAAHTCILTAHLVLCVVNNRILVGIIIYIPLVRHF